MLPSAMLSHSVTSGGSYATAMFKVLNSYSGWKNGGYVMNEVKRPVRTFKIAGPLGLAICVLLYMCVSTVYFSASTPEELQTNGITVASIFVSLSNVPNAVVTY